MVSSSSFELRHSFVIRISAFVIPPLLHGYAFGLPLFVRVDPGDVRVTPELRHPHFECPTLTIHDRVPNGVGLSERIYRAHEAILEAAEGVVQRCACRTGCPACIGPSVDQGRRGKALALAVLRGMRTGRRASGSEGTTRGEDAGTVRESAGEA